MWHKNSLLKSELISINNCHRGGGLKGGLRGGNGRSEVAEAAAAEGHLERATF